MEPNGRRRKTEYKYKCYRRFVRVFFFIVEFYFDCCVLNDDVAKAE